jgi:hypothetical protein
MAEVFGDQTKPGRLRCDKVDVPPFRKPRHLVIEIDEVAVQQRSEPVPVRAGPPGRAEKGQCRGRRVHKGVMFEQENGAISLIQHRNARWLDAARGGPKGKQPERQQSGDDTRHHDN